LRNGVKDSAQNPLAIVMKLVAQEIVSHSSKFEQDQIRAKRDPKRCLATLGLLEKITDQQLGSTPTSALRGSTPSVGAKNNSGPGKLVPPQKDAPLKAGLSALAEKVANLPKKAMFFEGTNQQFQRASQRTFTQVDLLQQPFGGKPKKPRFP